MSGARRLARRRLLSGLGATLLASACRSAPRRETILRALVDEVVTPEAADVVRRSGELSAAANRLALAPRPAELEALRAAWKRAILAWKRLAIFRVGPLARSDTLLRVLYWPARREAIDAALAGTAKLDGKFVEAAGSDVKGLFALEYLLFDQTGAASVWPRLAPEGDGRAPSLIAAYAEDVKAHAGRAARSLGGAFPASFANGGQSSLNQVVSRLIETLENAIGTHLSLALRLGSLDRVEVGRIAGGPSQTSHELLLASLLGAELLYRGRQTGGLATLVAQAAPALGAHIAHDFSEAVGALRALARPLEQVVKRERAKVEAAKNAVHALELTLKTELVNALGVTLDFNSVDAD